MSTRCHIEVRASGLNWDTDNILLYRHCDGYPSSIIPDLLDAWENSRKGWENGRPGKVAAELVAAMLGNGGMLEPMGSTNYHGDIEYLYLVECVNSNGGSLEESPYWHITVYDTPFNFKQLEDCKVLVEFDLGKGAVDARALIEATTTAEN